MKFLIFLVCVSPLAAAKVFNFKKDFTSKYAISFESKINGQRMTHRAVLKLELNDKDEILARVSDVSFDQKVSEVDPNVQALRDLFKSTYRFEFDEFGQIEIKEPENMASPNIIAYDFNMLKRLYDGERAFVKKIWVPNTEKRCYANFEVSEDDKYYFVKADVVKACISAVGVDSEVSISQTLFKANFAVRSYTLSTVVTQQDLLSTEPQTSNILWQFDFEEFLEKAEKRDEL